MYVCTCNGVRSRDVEAAIQAGAPSPRAVLNRCGAEPQCGRCLCEIRDRLLHARRAPATPVLAE